MRRPRIPRATRHGAGIRRSPPPTDGSGWSGRGARPALRSCSSQSRPDGQSDVLVGAAPRQARPEHRQRLVPAGEHGGEAVRGRGLQQTGASPGVGHPCRHRPAVGVAGHPFGAECDDRVGVDLVDQLADEPDPLGIRPAAQGAVLEPEAAVFVDPEDGHGRGDFEIARAGQAVGGPAPRIVAAMLTAGSAHAEDSVAAAVVLGVTEPASLVGSLAGCHELFAARARHTQGTLTPRAAAISGAESPRLAPRSGLGGSRGA